MVHSFKYFFTSFIRGNHPSHILSRSGKTNNSHTQAAERRYFMEPKFKVVPVAMDFNKLLPSILGMTENQLISELKRKIDEKRRTST